jgi:hypothetical protein
MDGARRVFNRPLVSGRRREHHAQPRPALTVDRGLTELRAELIERGVAMREIKSFSPLTRTAVEVERPACPRVAWRAESGDGTTFRCPSTAVRFANLRSG